VDKADPSIYGARLRPRPWTVRVEGLCARPKTYDLDELLRLVPLEERVYRLRCVEGWSMVIPWIGFPLASLIKRVEPTGKARFVASSRGSTASRAPSRSCGSASSPSARKRPGRRRHPTNTASTRT